MFAVLCGANPRWRFDSSTAPSPPHEDRLRLNQALGAANEPAPTLFEQPDRPTRSPQEKAESYYSRPASSLVL
jgi:hypothetical protein